MVGTKIRISLSGQTWVKEEIPWDDVLNHGGGTGLALKSFLERSTSAGHDRVALSPGLLAGTNGPAGHWSSAVFYDPVKGQVAVSYFGGHWGHRLRLAGIGLLEIEGKAPSMTVLVLENGEVHFHDAKDLEGLSPLDTCQRLETLLGDGYLIASIGSAGERGIPLASLVLDGIYQRQSAGLGAVLGRMGLKALAVKGTGKVVPHSPQSFYWEARRLRERFGQRAFPFRELSSYGTAWFLKELYEQGMLPIKNFTTGLFPEVDGLSGPSLADSFKRQSFACCGCPVGCLWTALMDGHWCGGLELEEVIALGALCGIADSGDLLQIKSRCDHFGMDPLALGGVIASVMENGQGREERRPAFGDGKKTLHLFEGDDPEAIFDRLGILTDHGEGNLDRGPLWVGFMNTDPRADPHLALHRVTWPLEEPHALGSGAFLAKLPVYSGLGKEAEVENAVVAYQDFYLGLQCLGFCPLTSLLFAPGDLDPLLKAALGEGLPKEATSWFGRALWDLASPIQTFNLPIEDRFGKLAREPIADGIRKGQRLDLAQPWQNYIGLRTKMKRESVAL